MDDDYRVHIKEWRELRELNQGELGALVGVTGATVSRWEAGKKGCPMDRHPVIAKALGLTHARWLTRHPDTLNMNEIESATIPGELREKLVRKRLDRADADQEV